MITFKEITSGFKKYGKGEFTYDLIALGEVKRIAFYFSVLDKPKVYTWVVETAFSILKCALESLYKILSTVRT